MDLHIWYKAPELFPDSERLMAFIKLHIQMVVGAQKKAQLYKSHQAPRGDHLCLKLWLLHCTKTNGKGKCLVN